MKIIKADLHMHGPIGFQDYWLKTQGYEGKNLLQEIADICFKDDIGLTAITSEADRILKGSIHDRFNWLRINCYTSELKSQGYGFELLGENIGLIQKEDKRFYLINAQTLRTNYNGKNIGVVVVGRNDIKNHRDFNDVIEELSIRNDILFGAGYELFKYKGIIDEVIDEVDYIEGFNSQLLPWKNWQIQKYAEERKKPWIAVSDAHRIEDLGISHIKLLEERLDFSTESNLISSLKDNIKRDAFVSYGKYEKITDWLNWVSKFTYGAVTNKDKV